MNRYGVTVRIPGVAGANVFFAFLAGAFARRVFRAMDTPRGANPWRGLRLTVGGERICYAIPALSHDLPHQAGPAHPGYFGEPPPLEHPHRPLPHGLPTSRRRYVPSSSPG